jgi:undecaprenyl-diphosphatase
MLAGGSVRTASTVASDIFHAISAGDYRLMLTIHRWRAPRWVRIWMLCATRGGDGWLWYTLGAVLLAFGGDQRFPAVCAAGIAVAIGILLFRILKKKIGRRRPCAIEPHCWSTLLPPDQFSFPSGHTITAFAVAVSLSIFYPELSVGLLFCAVSVAISRVMLGMHFLTDVLAGALLGSALAYVSDHLMIAWLGW